MSKVKRWQLFRRSFISILGLILLSISVPAWSSAADQDCINWFNAGKIEAGSKDCELKCAVLMTDMATFMCPDECDDLCKPSYHRNILDELILYPGLTPAEKELVESHPKDALIVFVQKTRAELSSSRNFPDQGLNDESDAFRHFMWAGLLTKTLGSKMAKRFLDAHEANPLQPIAEKNMDDFNNEKGNQAAQELISNKKWKLTNLESEGLKELRSKELHVIKPELKIPEKPQ